MARRPVFNLSVLRDLFECRGDGRLVRKIATSNSVKVGDIAGSVFKNGYRCVSVCNTKVYEHHVVWFLHTGEWPDRQIDHANGDRTDNRIDNLRTATQAQKNYNQKVRADSRSGVSGVCWHDGKGLWRAYLTVDGKQKYLGLHASKEKAIEARMDAERKYCGEFVRSDQNAKELSP